jgi:hypothetical protein
MLHPTFAIRVPHKESQEIHSTQQLSGSALRGSQMSTSQDLIVESGMVWQQCFAQLADGVSSLAGAVVILVQALPTLLNGFQ